MHYGNDAVDDDQVDAVECLKSVYMFAKKKGVSFSGKRFPTFVP